MPKNESFGSYLKELKLCKLSDIWTVYKMHNKLLTHELKIRLKYFKIRAHAIFNAPKKDTLPPPPQKHTLPAPENLSLQNFLVCTAL